MIQTHYVPLERPYRIIYTGGVIGLQVGTLIAVKSKNDILTTFTHPVVSYINKKDCENSAYITDVAYGGTYSEAVVWDKVDQSEVMTVCLEGQKLKWEEFLYFLTPLIGKCKDMESTRDAINEIRRFVFRLRSLGATLAIPIENETEYVVDLDYCDSEDGYSRITQEPCFYSDIDDLIPFAAGTNDDKLAFQILQRQLRYYKTLFRTIDPTNSYTIRFHCLPDESVPEYEKVKAMIDKLNKQM